MKILYVEDELSTNIPKIIRLFQKYLGDKNVSKLQKLEEDEYGASPQEIKEIIDSSDIVRAEYNFEDALLQVLKYSDHYSLFIVDRNLTKEGYSLEKIQNIDNDFDEKLLDKYCEREGDYLLEKLAYKGIVIKEKFYFLTAYSASELPNKNEISQHISLKQFKESNIIDKSKNEDFKELIQKINNIKILNLHLENKKYIDILRSKIKGNSSYNFIQLLQKKDDGSPTAIAMNLGTLRKILENILILIAKKKDAPEDCWNEKNKNQIVMRNVIYWIFHDDDEKHEKNYRFGSNIIIKNAFYNIMGIGSDFGSHSKNTSDNFEPTTDTVNSLVYQLKDLILWVDGIG
ncbi:MAG: hypothetical protein U9P79_01100 [Candidatus Cloacimonadota bacterium]|nr:hypothetical protein [Candidatus Cloacimonadota bacterium]